MPTLDPSLRDLLATVIGKENADGGARAVAEAGARAAIEALAVQLAAPYPHLDAAGRQLRNRLRARARQLGDSRHGDGRHGIVRLVEQAAYEHWHRMLFARFLAENDLLIHPEMKVAVTLDECAELAPSEGAVDGWELAGRYASRMLPQIFRPDDPLLALRFALDDVRKLEELLDGLPPALFQASDSLGWCYQFWQARKKKEVNASEVKIGADELPAVTQLFTEPYMVQFLLHNTLGAWWVGAGRTLPVKMPYLRLLDDGTPAAGTFEGWPRLARELKVLDPCCGSGHFLVEAFLILVSFRMAEEGSSAREACDAVLRDNLFGLEIDARCVQIAAFALALTAWTYPGAGSYRPLASMNVACSGLAISAKREEWERLGGENLRLRNGMGRMWELFCDAPVLGSLIDPTWTPLNSLYVAGPEEVEPLLAHVLQQSGHDDADTFEAGVAARGINAAALILGSRFSLVVTNVPYLARGKQSAVLQAVGDDHFTEGKGDLSTMFLQRSLALGRGDGTVAAVMPLSWAFLSSYSSLRSAVLSNHQMRVVVRLGTKAFETITGEVVNAGLFITTNSPPDQDSLTHLIDVSAIGGASEKAVACAENALTCFKQAAVSRNPDARIAAPLERGVRLLSAYAEVFHGQGTFDTNRFTFRHWELPSFGKDWVRQQSTSETTRFHGGCAFALRWEDGMGGLAQMMEGWRAVGYSSGKWKAGINAWGRRGIMVNQMGEFPVALYAGWSFDENASVVLPMSDTHLEAIWAFLSSREYGAALREIDSSIKVTCKTLTKVPFDYERWRRVAEDILPNGLPAAFSDDPTQWIYHGHPRTSDAPLHVAVARLLGYRWPDQQPDALDTLADADGIVCIPALRGERPAADRLTDLLAAAWGKDWHPQTLTDLLAAVGHTGSLAEWLRDAFFRQHCELFHHRPFVWQVWDGHREGFSALVNYHRLDHEGLKSLTYTYLGDWIRTQEIEARAGKSGAGDKLAKARALQQRLAAILEGEAPLDVFVRWKPIEEQPIGWHPDLDDGVRLNIRPFLTVTDVGAKGAGVLRWKPNVKWGKDRGRNPPGSPWGEDRDNDKHLTLAEKRAARGE